MRMGIRRTNAWDGSWREANSCLIVVIRVSGVFFFGRTLVQEVLE